MRDAKPVTFMARRAVLYIGLLLLLPALLVAAAFGWNFTPRSSTASAATLVGAATLNVSCYRVTPSTCKLQVDPFTLSVDPDYRLEAFRLQANGTTVYDFRTDVSNPPTGLYTPSAVKLDFTASCGSTYVLSLLADDTSQPDFLNLGETGVITCPTVEFDTFLPMVVR